jgi:ankyrin repeat protein
MPSRSLPARPDLDHLKHEAKTLRDAFLEGDAAAAASVHAVLGERTSLKRTEAQRVIAREYGFTTWAKLSAHVQSVRGEADPLAAFLAAILSRDATRALAIVRAAPHLPETSLHAAAVLGRAADVRRLIASEPARVHVRIGSPAGDALLWLCYSPFHGEGVERDEGLAAAARALLDAGADPNTVDGKYGVPALYALTGVNDAPRVARILLDAGARVTDGESVYHAAENFHEASLEVLLEYGVDLNAVGDWGNTPLYFLLRHWDVASRRPTWRGVEWLLRNGADPNVRCGRERESSLHVAVRRRQHPEIVRLLLHHGADVQLRRGDGRTAWDLASRAGEDALAALLEAHGAVPSALSAADALMAACGRGDGEAARALATPDVVGALEPADTRLTIDAAAAGRFDTVLACIAAGLSVNAKDENGATALHYAALHGRAEVARTLLRAGADHRIRDREHRSTPLGWACFGADHVRTVDGDYAGTVRALLGAGAELKEDEHSAAHEGVRAVLAERAATEP